MPSQLVWFELPVADTQSAHIRGVGRMTACRDDQGTRFSLHQPATGA
jgi:hypothetical protein